MFYLFCLESKTYEEKLRIFEMESKIYKEKSRIPEMEIKKNHICCNMKIVNLLKDSKISFQHTKTYDYIFMEKKLIHTYNFNDKKGLLTFDNDSYDSFDYKLYFC